MTNKGDDNVAILINTGAGASFNSAVNVAVGDQPTDIGTADFKEDANGDIDLIVTNGGDNTIQVLENDGTAAFPTGATILSGLNPFALDTSDLDNDKDADAVSANQLSNTITVAFNLGGGVFSAPITIPVGDAPVDVAISDFDGNGFADLVTANNGDGTVSVVLNNGDNTFTSAVNLPVGDLPRSLTTIDLEGDLDDDVAVVAEEAGNRVVKILRNDLTNNQLIFAAAADFAAGEDPALVTSGNLDGDSQQDLITVNSTLGAGPVNMGSVKVRPNITGPAVPPCPLDFDDSGDVGVTELLAILGQWGTDPGGSPDIDGDGDVGVTDLLIILGAWGPCTEP